jgi:transposase InsO family protein
MGLRAALPLKHRSSRSTAHWLIHYNTTRPHSGIGNRPPISRAPVRKDLRQNS